MKVSEIIGELQERLELYGDIEVYVTDQTGDNCYVVEDITATVNDNGDSYIEIVI